MKKIFFLILLWPVCLSAARLGTITITSPSGGEQWEVSSYESITWQSENVDYVSLSYSTNSGLSWETITSSTPASQGSYLWTVPYIVSPECLIKISDAVNDSLSVTSHSFSVFTSPQASTNQATDVTENTATLNGSVNANNSDADVSFDYGTSTSYGLNAIALQNPVSGVTDKDVNAPVTGLIQGTTYHFRIKAVNAAGTAYGLDQTFTTGKGSLAITSPAGGEEWQSGMNYQITWTSKKVDNVGISYSTDGGGSWNTITSSTPAIAGSYSWSVPEFLASSYRIRIYDALNPALVSTSNSFSVYSLPTAGTAAATGIGISSAVLNGTVSAGNTATTVTFEYGTSSSYGTTADASPSEVTGLMQTEVTAPINGLAPGVTYHYRVRARNSAGEATGSDRTFTTEAIMLSLIAPSGGERWLAGSTHSITWTGSNVSDVALAYSTDDGGNWITITGSTSASGGTYSWKIPNTVSSQYRIRISDASNSGISSTSDVFSVYSPPIALTNNATDVTVNSAVLNATVNPDNSTTDITFDYGTSESYGKTAKPLQTPLGGTQMVNVSAQATGLNAGTTYHFRVRAQNEAGTVYGNDMTFTADSIYLSLSSPGGGEEWLAGSGQNITWRSRNVTNVMILYSIDGGTSWITLSDAAPAISGSFSWTVPDSLSSSYKVRITDAQNVLLSSSSGLFSVFSPPEVQTTSPSNVTVNSAVIRGTVKAGNASTTVTFEYGTTESYDTTVFAQQNPIEGTQQKDVSAELTGLAPGTRYHYRAVAKNSAGTKLGNFITFTTDSIKLTISAPAGGETYKAGLTEYIRWQSRNLSRINIDYSTDDGKGWVNITSGISARDGKYLWTIPNNLSSNYRIRIRSSDTMLTTISKRFSVYSLPTAITNEASNITLTSAVLYASVSAGNSLSNVRFEYGTSTAYGLSAPAIPDTVSGITARDVSAQISGLSQSNIYHFRVRADNSAGTVYGKDKTFSTDGVSLSLKSPLGSEEWQSGSTQIISWRSKNVSNIIISYSADDGLNWTTITSGAATSPESYAWTVPGEASSKYRIRISDASNTSVTAVSGLFTVYSLPSALTNPAAEITTNSAVLKGTVNAGNSSTIASFEYGLNTSYGTTVNIQQNPVTGTAAIDVSASVSGLTPGAEYHYRLIAVNKAGAAFGSDMTFRVLLPELRLVSPSAGEEITGSVQYTITWTSSNVSLIKIDYSTDNGVSWFLVASDINALPGSYIWTVPNSINSSSCILRIADKNNSAVSDTVNGAFKISPYPQSVSLSGKIFTFVSPIEQSSYRMVSIPGESSQLKLQQFVQGEANKDWTMYYDNGSSTNYFVQYDGSAAFNFAPGRAFWILSRNPVNLSGEISTVALSSDGMYSIKLDHAGWNMIGSPFGISIAWAGIQALNNVTEKISGWDGTKFYFAQNMNAFEGYYFYNSQNLKSLKLPYKAALQKAPSGANSLSKTGTSDEAPLRQSKNSVIISLKDRNEIISRVEMGLSSNSSDDYDSLDIMAPPGDFEDAGMRIVNNSLSTSWKQLFTEFRSNMGEGLSFEVSLRNNTGRSLTLKCEGMENFEGYKVCLIDKRLSRIYDLNEVNLITLPSYAKQNDYRLLIGSSSFIQEENLKLMPREFSLFQNYPNPFNPATLIRYCLPEDAFVTVRIFDVLGREVSLLINGFNEAGFHEVSFTSSGMASGVYYYSMEAKGVDGNSAFRATKKMILVK